MTRNYRLLLTTIFISMLGGPLALFLLGHRPPPIDNRPATDRPRLTLNTLWSGGLGSAADAYLADALPGRDLAVRIDSELDLAFGDTPSLDVTIGEDGWLFLTESLDQRCLAEEDLDALADQIARASAVVETVGRSLTVAIAPDKASIDTGKLLHVPHCVPANAELLEELSSSEIVVTAWDAIADSATNLDVFTPLDTHWTTGGAAFLGEKIVEALAPGVWAPDHLEYDGERESTGDLSLLIGKPQLQSLAWYTTQRLGQSVRQEIPIADPMTGQIYELLSADRYVSPAAPIPGRTVVIHNSFGLAVKPTILGYFQDITFIERSHPGITYVAAHVSKADNIVVVLLQRNIMQESVETGLAEGLVGVFAEELPQLDVALVNDQIVVAEADGSRYILVSLPAGDLGPRQLTIDHRTYELDGHVPTAVVHVEGPVSFDGINGLSLQARLVPDTN